MDYATLEKMTRILEDYSPFIAIGQFLLVYKIKEACDKIRNKKIGKCVDRILKEGKTFK